jgi:hypothetical protein
MMIDLSSLFDDYAFRARVYPGLLACLPIVVTVFLLWPTAGFKELWSVAAAAGGTFFLANFVRSRGKQLEAALVKRWDGLPTTHMLRHREADNSVAFRRRRQGLELVFGETLPSVDAERDDPTGTDAVYIAATRSLIARVRSNSQKYPRVHEENIHYGFRRNLLAIKRMSLAILGILTAADIAIAAAHFRTLDFIAVGLDILMAIAWLAVVTESWVREAGQTYAERLFDTLEEDGLTS